ncbi:MAG: hypothetical protein R3A52_23520 [Polyangiales bacterium]
MGPTLTDLAEWRRGGALIDTLDGAVFKRDTTGGPEGRRRW